MSSNSKRITFSVLIALTGLLVVAAFLQQTKDKPVYNIDQKQIEKELQPQADNATFLAREKDIILEEDLDPKKQDHSHISVRVLADGVYHNPPRNLGVILGGTLVIHTHDNSGVVHMHRPQGRDAFKLSDIFAAWGLKYNAKEFSNFQIGDKLKAQIWHNGRAYPWGKDFTLKDKDDFVIELESDNLNKDKPVDFDWATAPLNDSER